MEQNLLTPNAVPVLSGSGNHPSTSEDKHHYFIEGASQAISMEDLCYHNIIPTFADNSVTLSHQRFIETTRKAAEALFGKDSVSPAEMRVSHPQIGRIPSAIHKKASELLPDEKTVFYQRLAWCSTIANITESINGQRVSLVIGGTRSYHEDRLYGKPSPQHFRIFIGFQVHVCSNLCLTTDGTSENLLCMTEADIFQKSVELFASFNQVRQQTLQRLESLHDTYLSQHQFCTLMGRLRLYSALPTATQKQLPEILLGDTILNAAVRGYVSNPDFGSTAPSSYDGAISCWQLLNLLNQGAKNSYADLFIERNRNCTDLAMGVANALNGANNGYSWFLN